MFNYIANISKSTAVTHCLSCNFFSQEKLNLILSKTDIIEIYDLTKEGLMRNIYINIYGKIILMISIPSHEKNKKDNLFVLSEDLDFALFSYNNNSNNIETILCGSINEEIGRKQDGILYSLDLMKNFLLLSAFKNVFKLICVNNNMRIKEKYQDFSIKYQYEDILFLAPFSLNYFFKDNIEKHYKNILTFATIKTDIIDMKRQIRETENTLSTLVGMHAQSISRGKLADQNLPENFSTGIALNVLSARPDVHAAEMKLANCFYDVKKAQSAFYPSLKITGTGSFTNSMGNAVSNPGFFLANFVAGLTQPIFMNGRLIAQLKVAKLSYEVAEKEWRQIILEAGAEVSNCLVEYNSSKEMEELERRQVEALAKSVDYTLMLYKMGTSSYLEVISAQSSLLNAEISQVVDEFNKMQAVVNLYSALGGGRE